MCRGGAFHSGAGSAAHGTLIAPVAAVPPLAYIGRVAALNEVSRWDLLRSANALLAAVTDPARPPPHGWIGTADDWARGLGIAFVVLALVVLAVSWERLRRGGKAQPRV